MPTRVRGVVLSTDGRTPVVGTSVQAYDPGTGFTQGTANTDALGNFTLSGLEDRTWIARLVSPSSNINIVLVKETWIEDEPHGQRTTLSAHGHNELRGVGPDDHHPQIHVLADSAALGPDHTVSGLTTGHVLTALSATTAAFQAPAAAGASDPLDLTERTVTSPSINMARVFANDNGDNTISIRLRTSIGEEYTLLAKQPSFPDPVGTLSAFADFLHVNTLPLNFIE